MSMLKVAVNEITTKIDSLLKKIEDGEICILTREGEPVFEIKAIKMKKKSWKKDGSLSPEFHSSFHTAKHLLANQTTEAAD